MKLALATDFNGSTGSPYPSLGLIAEAGFTHLHWCHQWNTDFLYGPHEIAQIRQWLRELGLTLLDIHGSRGMEKCFFAAEEYRRKAGIELVLNRARMLRELEGEGVLMMHCPCRKTDGSFSFGGQEECGRNYALAREQLFRSLDEMAPELEKLQVCIAMENMGDDDFSLIGEMMERYPASLLGITYDSGHGNCHEAKGLDLLEPLKSRLRALHLHDNDRSGDQHQPPFFGNLDWGRLAAILASSGYRGPMSFELSMRNTPFFNPEQTGPQTPENCRAFLRDARERCARFAGMVEQAAKAAEFSRQNSAGGGVSPQGR